MGKAAGGGGGVWKCELESNSKLYSQDVWRGSGLRHLVASAWSPWAPSVPSDQLHVAFFIVGLVRTSAALPWQAEGGHFCHQG